MHVHERASLQAGWMLEVDYRQEAIDDYHFLSTIWAKTSGGL